MNDDIKEAIAWALDEIEPAIDDMDDAEKAVFYETLAINLNELAVKHYDAADEQARA